MYDLILRGGTVVDGKRSQPYAADICIRERPHWGLPISFR